MLSLSQIMSSHVLTSLNENRLHELDSFFLNEDKTVKMLPAEVYKNACTHEELRVWCNLHAMVV